MLFQRTTFILLTILLWTTACNQFSPSPTPFSKPSTRQVSASPTPTLFTKPFAQQVSPSPTPTSLTKPFTQQVSATPTWNPCSEDWISGNTITLRDNGKTFTYRLTERFMVCLDDTNYPLDELDCEPKWIMGPVSNGSNMFIYYPINYEATKEGTCLLKVRDFHIRIVVVGL
jgi:hypothetical protein